MSSPPNPLDAFRTYAYHHILIACDGTTTAEALVDEQQLSRFSHPTEKFCPQRAGTGYYVVLINGMTDTQFFIPSVKWSSVIVPKVAGREQSHASTTMAVDGELSVIEPRGVNFYNVLNEVTKSLRIDPSAMVYLLKTVFVGITDAGTEEIITTIRPIPFMLTDITSKFDYTGAEYQISFVGMVNGAAKMPHANSIVQGFSGEIKKGSDIPTALAQVASTLNNLWETHKNKAIEGAKRCNPDAQFTKEMLEEQFMKVIYSIDAPAYAGYNAGDAYTENRKGEGETYISDFGEVTSIERIIGEVMNSSKKVLSELDGEATQYATENEARAARDSGSNPNAKKSERFMYKITSDVEVDRATKTYKVNYHVNKFVGTVIPADEIEDWQPTTPDNSDEALGITFDYIFTGKNIDIVEFDLDMQYGLTFLQLLGVHSSAPTSRLDNKVHSTNPNSFVAGIGNKDGAGDQKPPSAACQSGSPPPDGDTVMKPLFLGTMVTHPSFRDTRVSGAAASFNTLLHRIAALENIGARMKIRGNPQLLEDSVLQREDLVEGASTSQTVPGSERRLVPNMHKIPGYVKVNVMMPRSWRMDGTEDPAMPDDGDSYANLFWYKGWYQLLQIDHIFSEGEFLQELEIYSLPTDAGQSKMGKCMDEAVFSPKVDPNKTATPKTPPPTASTSSTTTSTGSSPTDDKTIDEAKKARDNAPEGGQ